MPSGSGLKRHRPEAPKTGPKLILPTAAGKAFAEAMHDLARIVERYGPLDRRLGVNIYKGLDLIDHRFANHPLNKVGIIVVAVQKLRQAEEMLAQQFRANLSQSCPWDIFRKEQELIFLLQRTPCLNLTILRWIASSKC